jgi:hypothetical protein
MAIINKITAHQRYAPAVMNNLKEKRLAQS